MARKLPVEGREKAPPERIYYPWDELEVGDHFFAPGRTASSMWSSMAQSAKQRGHEYRSETVTDTDENGKTVKGARVWRVK